MSSERFDEALDNLKAMTDDEVASLFERALDNYIQWIESTLVKKLGYYDVYNFETCTLERIYLDDEEANDNLNETRAESTNPHWPYRRRAL